MSVFEYIIIGVVSIVFVFYASKAITSGILQAKYNFYKNKHNFHKKEEEDNV